GGEVGDKKQIKLWVEQLRAADAAKRRAGAKKLVDYCTQMNAGAADLVPALTDALKDSDNTVRGLAADALGEIGPDAKAALPMLLKMLTDANASVRARAAFALGGVGANAEETAPALAHLIKDKDDDVRLNAVSALAEVGGKDALVPLMTAL